MINVIFKKSVYGNLVEFEISGHANYAPKGSDIVCASVSSMSLMIVNALIEVKADVDIHEEDGKLQVTVNRVSEKTALLLGTLLNGLKDITEDYTEYVNVTVDDGT